MDGWMIALCAVAAAAAAGLLVAEHLQCQREKLRVMRLRQSTLYSVLLPVLQSLSGYTMDEVRLERNCITMRPIENPGMLVKFRPREYRLSYINPFRLKALMQLIGEDMPGLSDRNCYRLRRYRVQRPNGQWDWAYVYSARHGYKEYVMRRVRYVQYGE